MNIYLSVQEVTAFMLKQAKLSASAMYRLLTSMSLRTATVLAVLGFCAFVSIANAQSTNNLFGGPEPLSPDEAFIPRVSSVSADEITVEFAIAPDYYLYKKKSSFSIRLPGGEEIDSAIVDTTYSETTTQFDDYFGESAVFRHLATIKLKHDVRPPTRNIELVVGYQGCADMGLCYPPIKTTLDVELPAELPRAELIAQTSASASGMNSPAIDTNALKDLFGTGIGSSDELLAPAQAFIPLVLSAKPDEISVQWQIEPGYYLYRDKLKFTLSGAGDAKIADTSIDEGTMQFDEFYGNVAVLRDRADASLLVSPTVTGAPEQAYLLINYQGCADIGVCFPPETFEVPVVFDQSSLSVVGSTLSKATLDGGSNSAGGSGDILATATTVANPPSTAAASVGRIQQSEQDRITTLLASKGIWLIVATFFGLGLLLAFTPCVLPMFPILSSLIVGHGDNITTGKAFRLSLIYVLVMAVTYAIVGVLVGMSGYNIQIALQNPWVLASIALIFVLLSLSMFGLYELQLPVSWQQKLTSWSNSQRGGEYGGVAIMGFISTLIVGPCVTAPLAGALLFIANTGDALTGGIALFALGIGMGVPLLLVGASAGTLVPKAGLWMDKVKHVFGILMLAMAIWMVSRVIPSHVTMALFGILAVMSAVYLGATDTLNPQSTGWQRLGKGSGIMVGLYGLALCVAALTGSGSYSSPLRGFNGGNSGATTASESHEGLQFTRVKSMDDLQTVITRAKAEGKPVMLDFYADWCVSCKEMEAFTFTDERVQKQLANAVLIQADVTKNDGEDKELLKYFSLFGPPAIIFYDTSGEELRAARVVGFMSASKFSSHIERSIGSSVASR